jgi:hypothetical protein
MAGILKRGPRNAPRFYVQFDRGHVGLATIRDYELAGDVPQHANIAGERIAGYSRDLGGVEPGPLGQRSWAQAVGLTEFRELPPQKVEKQRADVLASLA